jgi:multidrug resistance efflux pump
MKCRIPAIGVVLATCVCGALAEERAAVSLVTAQPLAAAQITATGRVQALVAAQVGARVSGTIAEFGRNESNQMLDVGMTVKAGEVLFRLSDTTFANAVRVAEATNQSASAALANLTAKTRDERLEQLRQTLAELDVRLADRQRDESRYQRLVEVEKTLPAKRLEEVQTEVAVLKSQRKSAEARLQEAENGPTKTEIALAEARVRETEVALKIAKDDLRDSTVVAPFDGMITRRFRSPGDYVMNAPHTEVLELVSMDKLEVELRVPETYFASVQAGRTQVTLRSPLLKGDLKLTVGRVVSQIDPASGVFAVRVPIPAELRNGIVPGVFVSADVAVGSAVSGVIVPQRALVQAGGKAFVFVAEGGKMSRRTVEVGDKLTESVIIKSGLTAGQKVVVGPVESLLDGAALPSPATQPK